MGNRRGGALALGNGLLGLGQDQLNVAGVRHVWVDLGALLAGGRGFFFVVVKDRGARKLEKKNKTYATVGAVRPPPLLGGLVDLDVLDDQVASVQALGVGVGLGVLEQAQQELG